MEHYSAIKKHEIMPWMDLEIITKWSKSERERHKYHHYMTYVWNQKYDTNEFIYSTETDIENRPVVAKVGNGGGQIEVWD